MSMNLKQFILIAIALAFVFSVQPASAQLTGDTTAAGDSCASFPQGGTVLISDSDGDYRDVVLICDGTNWQAAGFTASGPFEYSSGGNIYSILSSDTPAAIGYLDGTYSNVDWSADVPIIGFTSSGYNFIGAGTTWENLSGIWTNDMVTYIGQSWDPNDHISGGNFSGIRMSDNYLFEYIMYGDTVASMSDGGFAVGNNYNDATGHYVQIHKARGNGPVQNGDDIGGIGFYGKSSTNTLDEFGFVVNDHSVFDAMIRVSVESGTVDASVPTKMTLSQPL